jgi:hypothetical protein
MRRTTRLGALLALVVGVSLPTWGVGTSGAQEHHGDHDHGGGGTTTTTAAPTTTTTRPGSTTTTTRPAPTSTTTTTAPDDHDHGGAGGGDHHGNPTTTVPGPTTTTTAIPGTPGAVRAAVRYGPYTIPGAEAEGGAGHGHAHTGNRYAYFVQKPCEDCYITGMQADLVTADGRRAGWSTGAQLHHVALANWSWGRTDATCFVGTPYSVGLMLGQRFFASADDRTAVRFPRGFGYRVRSTDVWNLVWDLAGEAPESQDVYVQVTFDWVPASTRGMRDVEPVWLDVDQCDDSMISVPQGTSSESWTWNVNRPGAIVAVGALGHEGTKNVTVRNNTTGQVICDSRPTIGGDPLFTDPYHGLAHISSMSTCAGVPVSRVSTGQRVSVTTNYDMPKAVDDQLGIALAYVTQSRRPAPRQSG